MFGEETHVIDDITIRIRRDGSIELSHIDERGYRNSKVYYGYDGIQALEAYKEENQI